MFYMWWTVQSHAPMPVKQLWVIEEATLEDEVSIRSQYLGQSLENKTILQEEVINETQRMSGLPQSIVHEGTKTQWGKIYVRTKNQRAEVVGN